MTPEQEKEFHKKQFLISTKWIDVIRLLTEISKLQYEMFMELLKGKNENQSP